MADFAKFGLAVEKALDWNDGDFKKAYLRNRRQVKFSDIAQSKVARAIIRLKKNDKLPFTGIYKELLIFLKENGTPIKSNEKKLSIDINLAKKYLREDHRIRIEELTRSNKGRRINITVK